MGGGVDHVSDTFSLGISEVKRGWFSISGKEVSLEKTLLSVLMRRAFCSGKFKSCSS